KDAALEQAADGVRDRMREWLLTRRERIVREPSAVPLLGHRPFEIAHCGALERGLSGNEAGSQQSPRCPRVVGMRYVVMLELAPAAIVILLRDKPASGADGRHKALIAPRLPIARQLSVHDLAGVEDHRPAPRLAKVAGKGAVPMLNGKLPVKDALCPSDQGRSAQRARSRKERLDDVTAGFRIAREPSV